MSDDPIRQALERAIRKVAPEANLASLEPCADLREELDLDSMDFLNVLAALEQELGVDVPERDSARLYHFGSALAYLRERLGSAS
jgi:acyl carrier protein